MATSISIVDQQAVVIFDAYKTHQGAELIFMVKENGITPLFVPVSCTNILQPLDLSVNNKYKQCLKSHLNEWCLHT